MRSEGGRKSFGEEIFVKKPNIVFLLADDMGAWALRCGGNHDVHTPNLDKMAAEGVRFENFFCASPVCSPARASILTGTMPSRHGVLDWLSGGNIDADHPAIQGRAGFENETKAIPYLARLTTYTDLLAQGGYTCGLVGKWHLGDSLNPQHGFTHWYTIARGGCGYFAPEIVEDGTLRFEREYVTDLIGARACRFIDEHAGEAGPFYLSVHFTAPHDPWEESDHKKEYLDLYRDCPFTATPDLPLHPDQVRTCSYGTGERRKELLRGYYAAITAMDAQIGAIMDRLEARGVLEDTVVFFTSDNGMNLGQHGIWGKGNGTFPQNMFDSSVKVPFLAAWRGRLPGGAVCSELLSHYDVLPTLCEIAGVPCRTVQRLPGRSFVPWLRDPDRRDPAPVVVFDEYGPVRMIRDHDYKLILRYPYGPNELYDLAADPEETENLYGRREQEARVLSMRRTLERWFARYADPAFDARAEGVAGTGQRARPGAESHLLSPYGGRPDYVRQP